MEEGKIPKHKPLYFRETKHPYI